MQGTILSKLSVGRGVHGSWAAGSELDSSVQVNHAVAILLPPRDQQGTLAFAVVLPEPELHVLLILCWFATNGESKSVTRGFDMIDMAQGQPTLALASVPTYSNCPFNP